MRAGTRIAVSAGIVAITAALAGLSTWASFTDSSSSTHSVSTGVVDIELGAAGSAGNRLDIGAGSLAPGDTAQRALDLHNSSSLDLAGVSMTITATPSNALVTDTVLGLQVLVDRCSVPWTEAGAAPAYAYTCSGTTSTALASRPVLMTSQALGALATGVGGGTNHLRVRTTLPALAGNLFQGLAADLRFDFTAVQRAAADR